MSRGWLIVAGLLVAGCGGGEELGSEDATVAWSSTQRALNGGESGQPGALVGSSWTHDCAEGGSAKWEYEVDSNFLGQVGTAGVDANSANVSAKYNVVFKRCKIDGVRISGDMAYEVAVEAGDGSASTHWTYTGDLNYAGDVKGSCIIDMEGSASASAAGAQVSYSGSICGNDAAETLHVGFAAE